MNLTDTQKDMNVENVDPRGFIHVFISMKARSTVVIYATIVQPTRTDIKIINS